MPKNALLRHLLIGFAYLGLALIVTWPAVTQLNTHVIGSDTGDSFEMLRNVWYFTDALRNGEPLLWQPLLGYPEGISGSVFATVPLQYGPMTVLALLLPLTLSYNLIVLLYMALNGWAMYWLLRYLLADENHVPAFVAGVIYMAFPVFQAHLIEGHAGLLMGWAVLLYVWSLLRLTRAKIGIWRWLLATVFFFWLSTTGHILQAIYVLLPVTGVFGLVQLWQRDWLAVRRILLMGVLSVGLLGLLFLPVILESATEVAYAETTGYVRFSADALSIVSPSFLHPVFDQVLDYPRRVLGTNLIEGSSYLGLMAALLAGVALIKRRDTRWWLLLGGVAWLLSLGPLLKIFDHPVQLGNAEFTSYLPLPFALLQNLPGFSLARTPGRFSFTLALVIAVLAGYGCAWLWAQRKQSRFWHYGLVGVLVLTILFEYQVAWPIPTRSTAIPQTVYDLNERDDIRAVFNVPYEHLLAAKDALYLQTAHQLPLIAGQITRQTPVNPAKLAILQQTLDPALLHEAGADVVIFHKARAQEIDAFGDLQARLIERFGPPSYEDERIAIYDVPEISGRPDAYVPDYEGDLPLAVDFYVPDTGFVIFATEGQAAIQAVEVSLNSINLTNGLDGLGVYVEAAGFYRLRMQQPVACPEYYDRTRFTCLQASVATRFVQYLAGDQPTYDFGLAQLLGSAVVQAEGLRVGLHWQINQQLADTDIRFVHVLNTEGQIVWQSDQVLFERVADAQYSEVLEITEQLDAGAYTVRVGWYRLDGETLTPYWADDGQASIEIGQFVIE